MKALGIDFGERRIGLAISDPEGRVAVALETFERIDDRRAARKIAAIARDERIERLVLGEPRQLDGGAGEAAERVRRFGRRLTEATGLPLERIDEALTSVEAERRLRDAGVDPRRHPERVDAVAAQILLQESLDLARQGADPTATGPATMGGEPS
jgi:putative Holliday junction resolvase